MIELTPGQAELLDKIVKWFRSCEAGTNKSDEHPQYFAYSGAAGCGKTTVIKEFLKALNLHDDYIGCAFTGKAVLQLLKNNLNARTIHSLIYRLVPHTEYNPEYGKLMTTFSFEKKDRLDKDYRLIIVDEAPMVNDETCADLLSFKIPIIFLGDMNQLPPVFGRCTIMENPNHILTQIMRQSEDNPIIQLSQMVLKGIPLLEGHYGSSVVTRSFAVDEGILKNYDQIITVKNRVRAMINTICRNQLLHFENNEPRLFDKIICRQNNWNISKNGYYLTNGTSGFITDIDRSKLGSGYYLMNFHPDFLPDGVDFRKLHVDADYIKSTHEEQKNTRRLKNEKMEYSYAITVHLSQGSEYNRVLYIDDFFGSEELTRKARYTAITRAIDSITIVSTMNNDNFRQRRYYYN